jgi:hypothetical protein
MARQDPDWEALNKEYPVELVTALRGHFARGPFRIRARQLAVEANADEDTARRLLERIAATGHVTTEAQYTCPCERQESLTAEQAGQEVCAHCERAFEVDVQGRPAVVTVFVREAPETRDVRWMLALHGMNTAGAWQEEFNWLLSRIFGRSVPVAIYKYGVVRPGAVLKFRQRTLMRGLNARIRRLSRETTKSGFGGVPDVIAHSFGTWLLGHALKEDRTLRVGRVILTGCILRPDFDWALLFRRKQVQAVLCHSATKDGWARVAHYIIPDSGPSGSRGFNDRELVSHVVFSGGHHSDFFKDKVMPGLFERVWQPFLTRPTGSPVLVAHKRTAPDWKQVWWPFRATLLRICLLAFFVAVVLATLAALSFGVVDLRRLLFS